MVIDDLRAYLQIIDVASILMFHYDIIGHAFRLRDQSVEALAIVVPV